MANLTVLRSYASMKPTELPLSVLFSHTEKTMTIFDAYPKSIFHFLVLPRIATSPSSPTSSKNFSNKILDRDSRLVAPERTAALSPSVTDLSSLRALLNSEHISKDQVKELILSLKEDALRVKAEIEGEMEKRFGFVWDIWIGFHGVPSMEHIHLHVLSADLCSERMKTKKHYNSFHPKHGFFLHVDQVLSWFDAEMSYFQNISRLSPTEYESLLKKPLTCFYCDVGKNNMPMLKAHLQEEWEKLKKRRELYKKRRLESHQVHDHQCKESNERKTHSVSKKVKIDKS